MRPVQDGGAELGGLDRVLPAVLDQRAADEDDRREAVDQAELAHGVGHVDVGGRARQFAARTQSRRQPRRRRQLLDARPALGMARRDQRQQAGEIAAQSFMRVDHRAFLAGMGRGRRDQRAGADFILQRVELCPVGRRRRHVELEIAGGDDARRAQGGQALGVARRARQTKVEAAQQIDDGCAQIAPAPERILRQPRIDQDHRHGARRGLDDHVGPQVLFHEQREVRLPMVEEAAHEARHVERHELMDDAARQPLLGQPARGHRSGGHQHADPARAQPLDQRQGADEFADAGAVQPDQRPVRPRDARKPAPFRKPRPVLLAAPEPARQEQRRQGRHRRRQQPVGAQRGRQFAAHGAPRVPRSTSS